MASDLEQIVGYFGNRWKRRKVVLIGYSLGAAVLPFLAVRLSAATAEQVEMIALPGPSRTVEFECHLTVRVGGSSTTAQPVAPEIRKLSSTSILCLCGDQEADSLSRRPPA
jgi:type IV secretory pathway VirJ component